MGLLRNWMISLMDVKWNSVVRVSRLASLYCVAPKSYRELTRELHPHAYFSSCLCLGSTRLTGLWPACWGALTPCLLVVPWESVYIITLDWVLLGSTNLSLVARLCCCIDDWVYLSILCALISQGCPKKGFLWIPIQSGLSKIQTGTSTSCSSSSFCIFIVYLIVALVLTVLDSWR